MAFEYLMPTFFSPLDATAVEEPERDEAAEPEPTGFHVLQHVVSAEAALAGNVPGVAKADIKGKSVVLVYEFMIDSRETVTTQPGGLIFLERYSAGLQLIVIVREIKASFSVNLLAASVAANVGLANSLLKVRYKGLPAGAGPTANLPNPGVLNTADGLGQVIQYVQDVLAYVAEHPDQMTLEPDTIVMGRRAATEDEENQATCFAVKQIEKGKSMVAALKLAVSRELDPDVIRAVYRAFLNDFSEDPSPSREQRQTAKQWLEV